VDLDLEEEAVQPKSKKSKFNKENLHPSTQIRVTRSQTMK